MKGYKDRAMKVEEEREYFFPKHIPPVTIRAKSRDEAEEKLAELDKNTDHE